MEEGQNLGAARSFIQALITAPKYDYYSFSDQDDYWEQDKLISAVKLIRQKEPQDKPVLYYSNLNVADSELNIIRKTSFDKRVHTFESMITRRSIAGCTMVMNSKLRNMIKSRQVTEEMLKQYHDGFIVSLAYSTGSSVICDANAYMRYRQHAYNLAGSPYKLIPRIRKEYRNIRNGGHEAEIARALLETWDEQLDPEARKTLSLIAGYRENFSSRLKIFLSRRFVTGDFRLTLLGKVKAILGRL